MHVSRHLRHSNALCGCILTAAVIALSVAGPLSAQTIIVDNVDPQFTVLSGAWTTGAYPVPWGANYIWALTTTGSPTHEVEWRPDLPVDGTYQVSVWYVAGGNRADNAPFTIDYAGGSETILVNQRLNDSQWTVLGTWSFDAGTAGRVRLNNQASLSVVMADAVRWERLGNPVDLTMAVSPPATGTTNPTEGGPYVKVIDEVVNISATAGVGYQFDHWEVSVGSNVASPTSATTTVTMDQDKTVTAFFVTAPPVELTMAVGPSGTGTTDPAEGGPYSYAAATVVNILATPAVGYQFDHWQVSGGAQVANPNLAGTTVLMDTDKTVTAVFIEEGTVPPEFRGFWADVFHNGFYNAAQVDQMIALAVAGNYNAIVPEVLAYHDTASSTHGAYWKSNIVPRSSNVTASFDPLEYMVQQAHANGLECHPWLVAFRVSSTWPPSGNSYLAARPEFLMVPSANIGTITTVGGYYTLDAGGAGAQEYLISIVKEIVTNYEVDGIHWDYIRYTQSDAGYPTDLAYDKSSLARFKDITGYIGTPSSSYGPWQDFRRRTIDELMRRCQVEMSAISSNPRQPLRHTAALIAWGDAPANFENSSAYGIYQNWKRWMQMGYLDAGCPMLYYREHLADQYQWFRNWVDACINWRYDRHMYIGPGIYLNSMANSCDQIDYIRQAGGNGIMTYAYASTNKDGQPYADWYPYVASCAFTEPAPLPDMPWRDPATATYGTLWGQITDTVTGEPIDDATVQVGALGPVQTDGNGYYAVTLIPATQAGTNYSAIASKAGYPSSPTLQVQVRAGDLTRRDIVLGDTVPGDFDFDGDVDAADLDHLVNCSSGPNVPQANPDCQDADLDADTDVDQMDFGIFQRCISGDGNLADPNCAE